MRVRPLAAPATGIVARTLVLLLLVVADIALADDTAADETCMKRSACKCTTAAGMGIDLHELSNQKYIVSPSLADRQLQFYFHPCSDVDMQVTDKTGQNATTLKCEASTLCVHNRTAGTFVSLGRTAQTEFRETVTHDRFVVIKQTTPASSGAIPITTLIQLGCANVEEDRMYELPSETGNETEFKLVLYSRKACMRRLDEDHSLSTGAVLLITFFTLAFAYVVVGMTVNYFLVGARGIEMFPHLAFWRDFPGLVRDGVLFLQNGCTPATRDDLMTPHTPNQDSYVSI